MMVVNNFHYEDLETAHPIMARLLNGTFTLIVAIVTLNLLIALLTNTFEKHYENAVANAVMQRARTILLLQKSLGKKKKKNYYDFIRFNGSPEVIRNDLGRFSGADTDDRATIEQVRDEVQMITTFLSERLGKRFGKHGKKSDMEFVRMDLCKLRVSQEDLVTNMKNMKMALNGIKEMVEYLKDNNNNNSGNNNNNENNEGSNDINNTAKTTNVLSGRATTSAVTNVTLQQKASSAKKKLYKKRKDSEEEEDSETEGSSTTQASSIENDSKKSQRGKSSKKQEQTEKRPKKQKDNHNNYNDDDQTSASKESNEKLGDYSGNQQSQNRRGNMQPARQEFWNNNGYQSNVNSLNTGPRFIQTSSSFSPWQRNQMEPEDRENQREYHAHHDAQIHFSEFRQQAAKRPNGLEFSNPRCVTNIGYKRWEENNNFPSSPYYTQPTEQRVYLSNEPTNLKGGRLANNRVHQPVFPPVDDSMTYPGNMFQPVPGQNVPGQNDQRYLSGQNFESPDRCIQNSGYEQDEGRNRYVNEVSSYGDGQEHIIQQQSGYTNYRSERDFRDDVGPTRPIKYHRLYLNTTEQGQREYSPRLADTHEQSAQSREMHTQAQYPSNHERETRSNGYNPYDIVPQKIHSSLPPERPQQPPHLSSQTTQSDNRMSSKSSPNRDFNVVNPSQSSQGSIDMTQVGEPRGLVTLPPESSQDVPGGTKKQLVPSVIVQSDIDSSSGLRRTPSFVQHQIIKIENATSQVGQGRTVRSHSFATTPPETKDKEKRFSFDSGRMALLMVSHEASSLTQLPTNNQFQDQIESGVHGQPTPSSFSPNPVISTRKPDVSAQYPDISAEYPNKSSKYPSMSTKSANDSSRSSTPDKMSISVARKDRKKISDGDARDNTDTEDSIEASPQHKVDKMTKGKLDEEVIWKKSERTSKSRDDNKEMSAGESIESQNDNETEESIEQSPELKEGGKTTQNKINEEGMWENISEASSSSGENSVEDSADDSRESQNKEDSS